MAGTICWYNQTNRALRRELLWRHIRPGETTRLTWIRRDMLKVCKYVSDNALPSVFFFFLALSPR